MIKRWTDQCRRADLASEETLFGSAHNPNRIVVCVGGSHLHAGGDPLGRICSSQRFPWAILTFAALRLTNAVLVLAAIGAYCAWLISLYSYRTLALAPVS